MLKSMTNKGEDINAVKIFSVPFTICNFADGIRRIEKIIADRKPHLLVLANTHTLNLAYEISEFKEVLTGEKSLVLRDGIGIAWALKKRDISPLHNFVGTTFIPEFCKATSHRGYRVYLLGARPGIAELAAKKLSSLAPGIVIAGFHHGYFPEGQTAEIISRINDSVPHILLVAMGNPKQELWIAKNLHRLNAPLCIGVGGMFDYLSGLVPRAPGWMLQARMEWVFRLLIEPRRLWKRYIIGNPKFIMRVYRECLGKNHNNKPG